MEEIKSNTEIELLSIENTISDFEELFKKNESKFNNNLNKFLKAFNAEYPEKNLDKVSAEALTWALMDGPLILNALNMNGPAIIELHGILERFAMREIIYSLNLSGKQNFLKLFERHTLPDFALLLFDLEILDNEDIKFINKLNGLRNGLAHKNPKPIYNRINRGKPFHMLDIDEKISNYDIHPYIFGSIRILVKLSKNRTVKKIS